MHVFLFVGTGFEVTWSTGICNHVKKVCCTFRKQEILIVLCKGRRWQCCFLCLYWHQQLLFSLTLLLKLCVIKCTGNTV